MTLTWVAFESALSGHLAPPGALDALAASSMEELQAILDRVGADEAGRLLAEALSAGSRTRPSKLAACLEIIDRQLPVGRLRKSLLTRRRVGWAGQARNGDAVRAALVASLIDAELGGDPERLRSRLVMVTARWETGVVARLRDRHAYVPSAASDAVPPAGTRSVACHGEDLAQAVAGAGASRPWREPGQEISAGMCGRTPSMNSRIP